jgi:hypothetical protein
MEDAHLDILTMVCCPPPPHHRFNPPKTHLTDSITGSEALATLPADLSSIPLAQLDKRLGADGKEYYVIRYEIRGVFYSAHIEYSLWYNDQCYGKVDAKYE